MSTAEAAAASGSTDATKTTRRLVLVAPVLEGIPQEKDFRIEQVPIRELTEGGIEVQLLVVSADPYMRGGIKRAKPGSAITGFVACKVAASKNSDYKIGDLIGCSADFKERQVFTQEELQKKGGYIWKLPMLTEANVSLAISIFGMPGATAYGGLKDILQPKKGEVLWVSGGYGAVGSMVGQLAVNVFGLTVIGSAGGPVKCAAMKSDFGFHHTIDYKLPKAKTTAGLSAMLKEVAPKGIDMYFDNVGSTHLEAAFDNLKSGGRIAVCGSIASYNDLKRVGERLDISKMIYGQMRIEGFVCSPWLAGQRGNFLKDMHEWYKAGKIGIKESFFNGLEQWPAAFQSLFTGKKKGKVVVKL